MNIKIGKRNKKKDEAMLKEINAKVQEIQDLLKQLGINEDVIELDMDKYMANYLSENVAQLVDEQLKTQQIATSPVAKIKTAQGECVKHIGNGKVEGYLVLFSTPDDPDMTGDYFTKDTNFGDINSTSVLYGHALDKKIGKEPIGVGTLKVDDKGVWIEGQLDMRRQYIDHVVELLEKNELGWSSGTAPHLVERKSLDDGKTHHITRWPLGLDASLTPIPAEPRTIAIASKTNLSDFDFEIEILNLKTGVN